MKGYVIAGLKINSQSALPLCGITKYCRGLVESGGAKLYKQLPQQIYHLYERSRSEHAMCLKFEATVIKMSNRDPARDQIPPQAEDTSV